MVLADDNFATIVAAVEEGRRIYDNIRRFVRYLLTTNSAEIWVMFLAPFAGLPIPLLPIHILWINLVTDGPPALALGVEPVEPDTMRRPPRPPSESIFARGLWQHALWVGLLMGGVSLGIQALAIDLGWHWQTMVFSTLAFLQLGHALAVRSERESLFRLGLRTNTPLAVAVALTVLIQLALIYLPPLQPIFETGRCLRSSSSWCSRPQHWPSSRSSWRSGWDGAGAVGSTSQAPEAGLRPASATPE